MGATRRMRSKKLPAKLRQIRITLDLTQDQLLEKIGFEKQFSRKSVSSWETDSKSKRNTEPPFIVIVALARYLNICPAVLMDDDLELPGKLPVKKQHKERD